MSPETLAPDVAWEPSGHLSEVALSVAADGEYTLFDAAMHEHLAACEACSGQLGLVALRSADVAEALAAVPELAARQEAKAAAREPAAALAQPAMAAAEKQAVTAPAQQAAAAPARTRAPLLAIAAALVVAALGALPSILTVPAQVAHGWSVFQKVAPSMLRLAPLAVHRAWSGGGTPRVALMWVLAAMLVAMGLTIAKRASNKMALDGGRR